MTQDSPPSKSSGATWLIALLVIACLIESFLIVKLSSQIQALQTRVAEAETKIKSRDVDPLTIGELLPTLTALGRDGNALSPNVLDFSADRVATVVVALGTACPVCEEKLPELSTWASQVEGGGVVVVAIQIDAMNANELKPESPGLPLVFVHEAHKTWLRRTSLVPSVLVFDRQGALRAKHDGVMDAESYKQIEQVLNEAKANWK